MCIDISQKIIKDVIAFNQIENKLLVDFLFSEKLFINKYDSQNSSLGKKINQKASYFNELIVDEKQLNKGIFYSLAENVVYDQSQWYHSFTKLNAVKTETNHRLFQLVWDAKQYLDLHFLENITIENVTVSIGLSEYHFI